MNKSQRIQSVLLAFVLFVIVEFPTAHLFAEPAALDSSIQYSQKSSSLSIDQTITLKVSLKWPGTEDQYRFAIPSISAKNLDLLRIGQAIKKDNGVTSKEFEYEFKPSQTGTAEIPNFKIPYTCQPDCGIRSVNITGKTLQITLPRKSSALWQISLIIIGISFPVYLIARRKLKRDSRNSTNAAVSQPSIEETLSQALKDIDQRQSNEDKINALSKLIDFYRRKEEFQLNSELGHILSLLETLKFSGPSVSDSDYETILNKVRLFVQKNKIITPS